MRLTIFNLEEKDKSIAIAVALIPPLAITGIGIANFDWSIISEAFLLFLINILGIIFASMVIFSLSDFYVKRKEAAKVIKEEDKVMETKMKESERG